VRPLARVALVALVVLACAHGAESPGGAAAAFGAAVARGDAKAAYALTLSTGEPVVLVAEGGGWRVDGPAFDPWGQGTPRAALRTFIRALDERRYDVLLRLAPNRYRGDLSVDKLRQYWEEQRKDDRPALLGRLRAAAAAPIVESGDEAHLPYGPEQEVRFLREDGRWKIESPG